MPRELYFDIDIPGQTGVVKDTDSYQLPNNAWSDAINVNFRDGKAIRADGEQEVTAVANSLSSNPPYYLKNVSTDSSYFWILGTGSTAHVTDLSAVNTIWTPSTSSTYWSSGFLQGLLLLTNGSDAPQTWVPGLTNTTDDLVYDASASTTWAGVNASARVIRTFREWGVALDTTESSNRNSRRVWWSHPADAGSPPATWDYSKPAYDAGQVELDDESEPVIDCLPMRGDNLIYKNNSIHRMSYVGPPFIFSFSRIFNNIGLRSIDCAKEFFGRHVVFGFEDAIVHDGVNSQPILDRAMRRWLINNIDDDSNDRCCVVVDYAQNEVYFMFPEVGESFVTKALVWGYHSNTTTIRDLDNKTFGASGVVDPSVSAVTYAGDIGQFDAAVGPFDSAIFRTLERSVVFSDSSGRMSFITDTDKVNQSDFTSFVERQGVPLPDESGRVTNDLKFIRRLYPRINGGSAVTIKLAEQMNLNGPIKWNTYSFDPTTDYKIDVRVTTRIPAIWVGSESGSKWEFHGMGIEYQNHGMR